MIARRQFGLRLATTAALLMVSTPAWSHSADEHVEPGHVIGAWSWEPLVVAALLVSAAWFAIGVARSWRRAHPARTFATWHVGAFAAGWLVLAIALVSPVHRLGSELFSVHMAQHELLMLVAAPLLVLSRPGVPMLWAIPETCRSGIGAVFKLGPVSGIWKAISDPLVAWLLHGTTLWIWHAPALYQAALRNEWLHGLQHSMFFATALLFWWTLIAGHRGRLGYGGAVLYVFTTAVHSSVLGALITFSQRLWYPIYEGRTVAWHLTALEDQQLGGLIMWIPAGVVLTAIGLVFLASWLRDTERRSAYTKTAFARSGEAHA